LWNVLSTKLLTTARARFELNLKQVAQVSKVFDNDGTGSIDYEEFVKFCETKNIAEAIRNSKKK